ncbi:MULTISPECIES: DUF2982 domain-containing protein [Vibrio]|uniref:DUF2982 domain-containing protein n=1 Tax=Vibrio TaxID=662 RepID=UPI0001B945D8|nr:MULTISPECIES: DUF2982 domain-containing protein [Vibrio]EEX33530.1 hypothetical protein VIC_001426 [Vibrio coralliilyticus ATCC BAA-450]MCM5509619.1 DUF2982 domain-containing protein [Vibrio sp. SCSIO 43169]MDE3895970.1 DUF2982 domain-containing protein [Vibrio sp. CC007]NRF15170.1 DUF2982 domain-containing protein [Vibrio coralliilyticus]NRF25857.1 DUF2982 domain-containing protein [Vibrio coralliilyticus]
MQTLHLTNQPIRLSSPIAKILATIASIVLISLVMFSPDFQQAVLTLVAILSMLGFGYLLILKSTVSYTLTATHFQQHLFKGGWVVKWSNVSKIGICHYDQEGWQQPLPWIGIKLKHYSPYLDSICPRIATEILLSQRALLYLGAKQSQQGTQFEDIVLDSKPYKNTQGEQYSGLQAMLANRMRYQRSYFDYDIFISAHDLDRSAEEFVGLARRYLAAAEPEEEYE